jgi:hypothetical protein
MTMRMSMRRIPFWQAPAHRELLITMAGFARISTFSEVVPAGDMLKHELQPETVVK